MSSGNKCVRCGKIDNRTNAGRCCCETCAMKQREQKKALYNQRVSEKLCVKCGKQDKQTLDGKTMCFTCAL